MSPGRQKLRTAARRKDDSVAVLLGRAQTCLAQGQRAEALELYGKILDRTSADFDTLHLVGLGLHMAGDRERAVGVIRHALMINPRSAEAHANLGAVLRALARLEDALESYDQAIALDPNFANAHFNRANVLDALGQTERAAESYGRAIALKPNHASAYYNRGILYSRLKQRDAALADFDAAVVHDPRHASAWTSRAEVLVQMSKHGPALESFDQATAINPNLIEAWLGAASLLAYQGKIVEAEKVCLRALAIQPKVAMAQMLLAQCHMAQGRPEAAVLCFERALALEPDHEAALSNKIFAMDFASNYTFAEHHRARRDWWGRVGSKRGRATLPAGHDRDPERKLVLGYVSGDFRKMSPALATRPVLQNHDRSQFEIVCYSTSSTHDDWTDSFRAAADRWRDVSQRTDDEIEQDILADKVDILIDLSGHTLGNMLRLFARKLAPLQVTAWGHATGTGLPTMDYLLSDPIIIPEDARQHFAEKIWDLPCCIIIEPPSPELRAHEPPVLKNGYLTYGVFNRVSKFSDAAVAAWIRILQSDPTSRLIVKDTLLDDASVRDALMKRFQGLEGAADRVDMIGRSSRDDHLRTLARVDVCLDPLPCNGGVSSWEAAYMGVPVVSKLGENTSSRVGGAIMSAIGLSEFVAETEDDYVRIALGAKTDRLQALRRDLPAMIEATCGPVVYTRAVEAAYRSMWQTWCASEPS